MTPGARLQAVIELLDQVWSGNQPADRLADAYFKRRRYAGSSDRRGIQEILYQILRHRARLDWWIKHVMTIGSVSFFPQGDIWCMTYFDGKMEVLIKARSIREAIDKVVAITSREPSNEE